MEIVDEVLTSCGFGYDGPEVARTRIAAVLGGYWKLGPRVDRAARDVLVALGPLLRDVQDSRIPPSAAPDLPAVTPDPVFDDPHYLGAWLTLHHPVDGGLIAYVHKRATAADLARAADAIPRCPQCQVLGADRCDHPASLGPAGIPLGTEPCA